MVTTFQHGRGDIIEMRDGGLYFIRRRNQLSSLNLFYLTDYNRFSYVLILTTNCFVYHHANYCTNNRCNPE